MYSNRTLTGSGLFQLHNGLHHYDDLSVHTSVLRFDGLLYFRKLKGGSYKRRNVMLSNINQWHYLFSAIARCCLKFGKYKPPKLPSTVVRNRLLCYLCSEQRLDK